MKKLRNIIIILIILLIITILGMVYLEKNEKNSVEEMVSHSDFEEEHEDISFIQPVTSRTNYYILQNIINKYYNSINNKNYDVLYNYLSNDYIKEFNIENTGEKFTNTYTEYEIQDMYVLSSSENIFMYLVKTNVIQNENSYEEFIMVGLDISNSVFEIYPDEYVRKYDYDSLKTTSNLTLNEIEFKEDNTFSFEFVTNEEMSENYLQDFKKYVKNKNYKKIYEMLDEEYKETKFSSYEDFEEYMQINYDRMSKAFLDMYKVKDFDSYKQYICIDSKENYYVFNETAVMKYTLILDNYTIDFSGSIEEYEGLKNTEKATLNIKKFLKSIEDGDYKYAYNKLSKDFKNKYFETLDEFKQYVKQNIINNKTIEEVKVEEKDGLYVCTFSSKDNNIDYSNKKFIVQLDEGTNFQISFSVQ